MARDVDDEFQRIDMDLDILRESSFEKFKRMRRRKQELKELIS